MTLEQIRTKVRARIEDTAFWTDAKITQMVNDAMLSIFTRFNITRVKSYEERPTVASQKRYNLPSDCIEIYYIYYNTGYSRIIEMVDDPKIIYRLVADVDTEGAPTHAYIWGVEDHNELWLHPVPDDVYDMQWFFWAMPAELVNNDDEPMIPLEHHQYLADYAIKRTMADDEKSLQAEIVFENWWEVKLMQMKIGNSAKANQNKDMAPGMADAMLTQGLPPYPLRLSSGTYRW